MLFVYIVDSIFLINFGVPLKVALHRCGFIYKADSQ